MSTTVSWFWINSLSWTSIIKIQWATESLYTFARLVVRGLKLFQNFSIDFACDFRILDNVLVAGSVAKRFLPFWTLKSDKVFSRLLSDTLVLTIVCELSLSFDDFYPLVFHIVEEANVFIESICSKNLFIKDQWRQPFYYTLLERDLINCVFLFKVILGLFESAGRNSFFRFRVSFFIWGKVWLIQESDLEGVFSSDLHLHSRNNSNSIFLFSDLQPKLSKEVSEGITVNS